jgi:uncharacterized protein YjdB
VKWKFLKVLAVCLILLFTTTAAYARGGNAAVNSTNQGNYLLDKNKNNKQDGEARAGNQGNKDNKDNKDNKGHQANKSKHRDEICDDDDDDDDSNQGRKNPGFVAVTGITLNKTSATLAVKSWERLAATVQPANATDKKYFWFSSNPRVVSVNPSGKITGLAPGTAIIYVATRDGFKTASCSVTVGSTAGQVRVSGISLNLINTIIPVGFADTLRYKISPSNASDQDVRWSSSNSAVAAVDAFGRIEAKAVGTAVITVTTLDGAKSASCLVVVTPRVNPPYRGILLNKASSTMLKGEFDYPAMVFYPANENNYSLTWTTSDAGVATVDQNGRVTARGLGTAIITVRTSNNWSASYIVMVVQ